MTTISIPGKITAVEIVDDIPSYSLTTVTIVPSGGNIPYPYGSPLTINPSGALVTGVMYDDSALVGLGGQGPNYFQLSSSFNIGDVIEIYRNPTAASGTGNGVLLNDSSGNSLPSASSNAYRLRKVQSGQAVNWVPI